MRVVRSVLAVLIVSVCLGAASAAAANGPAWPVRFATTPKTAVVPIKVHVMTLAKLPHYPWTQPIIGGKLRAGVAYSLGSGAQPVWLKIGGLTLPRLSH